MITDEGHLIVSWPWSRQTRRAAGGLPAVSGLSLPEVLAQLQADRRSTAIPLEGLGELDPPWSIWPQPSHVVLDDPVDDPVVAWSPWWRWLSASRPVYPAGPVLWVDVPYPMAPSWIDIDAGIVRGHLIAGSGPDLWLTVEGARPGEIVPRPTDPATARIARPTVEDPAGATVLTLISGGEEVGSWPVDAPPPFVTLDPDSRWVVGVLWTPGGGPWATTAPIWLSSPASGSDGPRRSWPPPPR